MKLFCTLFLLSFLLTPLELFAAPKVPAPLSINLETEIHNSIVPGDLVADTFFIKNQSEAPVKFRLSQVNNLEDSKLFAMKQIMRGSDKDRSPNACWNCLSVPDYF